MKNELESLRQLLEWESAPLADGRNRFDLRRTKALVWGVECFIHGIEVGHESGMDLVVVVEKALYLARAVDGSLWDRVAKCLETDKSRKFMCMRAGQHEWSFQFYGRDCLRPEATERGPDPQKALETLLKSVEDWDRNRATPTESDPVVVAALEAVSASDLETVRRFIAIKETAFKTACDKTKATVLDWLLEIHARLGSQVDDPDGNKTARSALKFLRGPKKDHSQEINRLRDRLIYQFQLWIES